MKPLSFSTFLESKEGRDMLRKAEESLDRSDGPIDDFSVNEIRWLIHKLRVYQVELEMQNEELRQAQQLLAQSRARYVRLFQLCPDGRALINDFGVLLKVNDALLRLFGNKGDTLQGRPLHELLTPESRQIFLTRFQSFFKVALYQTQ